MAFTSLQRTTFSALLSQKVQDLMVYGYNCNNDYQLDANGSRIVTINSLDDVSITDYSETTGITGSLVSATSQNLTMDQQKAFSSLIPVTVTAESNIDSIKGVIENGANQLAIVMDQYIAGLHTQVVDTNLQYGNSTTPISVKAVTSGSDISAYDAILRLGTLCNKYKVPVENRYVIVPWDMLELLSKDSRFTIQPNVTENGLVQGQIINGLQVYASNNVSNTGGKYKILAGSKKSITLAKTVQSIEMFKPENHFGDAVKGLWVYGAKVIKPLVVGTFTF